METFHTIGGTQQTLEASGKSKDGETFGDVGSQPLRQTRSSLAVLCHRLGQLGFWGGAVGGIEDRANVCDNFCLHVLVRHLGLGILLQMELAPLPGDTTKDR